MIEGLNRDIIYTEGRGLGMKRLVWPMLKFLAAFAAIRLYHLREEAKNER